MEGLKKVDAYPCLSAGSRALARVPRPTYEIIYLADWSREYLFINMRDVCMYAHKRMERSVFLA